MNGLHADSDTACEHQHDARELRRMLAEAETERDQADEKVESLTAELARVTADRDELRAALRAVREQIEDAGRLLL